MSANPRRRSQGRYHGHAGLRPHTAQRFHKGLGFRAAYPLNYNAKVVLRGSMAFAQWPELDCVNRPFYVNMLKADTVANLSGKL
jgi:hypothetical protein